jgi:hypothetical protein
MVALDPVGNVSLILQMLILFLLVLGLPLVRGVNTKKNLIRHGYLTVAALALHTILIFVVMIPSFSGGLDELGSLSLLDSFNVWSHAVLGTTAEVFGFILVIYWLAQKPSNMRCTKLKRWMTPIFAVWIISIVNGTLIHILGML